MEQETLTMKKKSFITNYIFFLISCDWIKQRNLKFSDFSVKFKFLQFYFSVARSTAAMAEQLYNGAATNRQYWHLSHCNRWTDWSNPDESGIAAVASGLVSENVAQLQGASMYRRQKEIKTEPLNRNCLYFNTQRKTRRLGCVSKQDRLTKSSLAEAQGFHGHIRNLFVTSYFQHVPRGHFHVS